MAAADGSPFAVGPAPELRGEESGEGAPVVLCHGITASRRYVLHGSRALGRAGHEVVLYDARGHGESDPAPAGEGYGYPLLIDDLERLVEDRLGDRRFLLGGHSMGAHAAAGYALRHPDRLTGLVLIGPTFDGEVGASALRYWDGLADALGAEGIDGFLAYIEANQGIDPAFLGPVLRFTRERMLLHRHLGAVEQALREVPRSRPFESLEQLAGLDLPALVVASRDEADPGHPRRTAEAYAEAIPGAELAIEPEGSSPLAWQGGRLSREIAAFHSKALSS
jgi:pimeloyl-ACP methyl ester carboxylesterase